MEKINSREKYLNKYFTKIGQKALTMRLTELIKIWRKEKFFPHSFTMLGFPMLKVYSKKHLEGMIDELRQILGIDKITLEVKNEHIRKDNSKD